MTWTDQKDQIRKIRNLRNVQVVKNYKQYYKKYNHKMLFVFTEKSDSDYGYQYRRFVYNKNLNQKNKLITALNKHKIAYKLVDNYLDTLVYVEDVNTALKAVPSSVKKYCQSVHLMDESVAEFYRTFTTEDFKGMLTVKKSLPHGRYRYRVNFSKSSKKYLDIDESQLSSAAKLLQGYKGLHFPYGFEQRLVSMKRSCTSAYFYAENLNWLSMFLLATPSIIHSIELFKTEEEINKGETINEH